MRRRAGARVGAGPCLSAAPADPRRCAPASPPLRLLRPPRRPVWLRLWCSKGGEGGTGERCSRREGGNGDPGHRTAPSVRSGSVVTAERDPRSRQRSWPHGGAYELRPDHRRMKPVSRRGRGRMTPVTRRSVVSSGVEDRCGPACGQQAPPRDGFPLLKGGWQRSAVAAPVGGGAADTPEGASKREGNAACSSIEPVAAGG